MASGGEPGRRGDVSADRAVGGGTAAGADLHVREEPTNRTRIIPLKPGFHKGGEQRDYGCLANSARVRL